MKIEEFKLFCDVCGTQITPVYQHNMINLKRSNFTHITITHNNQGYTFEKDLCEICYKKVSDLIFKIEPAEVENEN